MRFHQDEGIGLFSADERLAQLSALGDRLEQLNRYVDFEFFRPVLEPALYGAVDPTLGGRPPFDPVLMFKILVLQRLYNLSDEGIEYQITDRLSFMRFLGLDFAGRVPDAKTVWLFRETLQQHGLIEILFEQFNAHLAQRHIIVNNGQIADATFVEAPRQRNNHEENALIKEGQVPALWLTQPHRLAQKDVDARWAKKGDETHYGYKDHVLCDRKSKLITAYEVTDASVHDSVPLDDLLAHASVAGQKLYADSAYRSAAIETDLATQGIQSKVHERAYRGTPLTPTQQERNTAKSRIRARIEHVFAFMTQSMHGLVVRGRSLARNEAVIGLINLAYNLCRVVQLKKKIMVVRA
jgi:transposase, IS5 family